MQTYRVYGEKVHSYYTDVPASDPDDAYDIASSRSTQEWHEVENDEIVEVSEVIAFDKIDITE